MNAPPAKIAEITASALLVNLVAIPVTVLVVGGVVAGAMLLPHAVSPGRFELLWGLTSLFALLALHELIHAVVLKFFARLPRSAFKFGFSWRQMILYCHCRQPVTMRVFRYCALAPLTILGSLSILATLLYPAIWLALVTGTHLSGCIGDVWLFVRSRRFPDHFLFLDFPHKMGGEVFETALESPCDSIQPRLVT